MERHVIIGGREIPFVGTRGNRAEWGHRNAWGMTMKMTPQEAAELFVDGVDWHISTNGDAEDCSEYVVAGPITDNRDGTVTVLMGAKTKNEKLAEQEEKVGDLNVLVSAMLSLAPGQLKKVLTEDVLAVLRKYGYAE